MGLTGSTGRADGDWRLRFRSDLDVEVLSYIRTRDGFVTAMHDLAPVSENCHRVVTFNPGSNNDQVSSLRLINLGSTPAQVNITGIDDNGESPTDGVRVSVPSRAARSFTAADLELGTVGLEGALGDGAGKWRLQVRSVQDIEVMSLLESPTGHLTNLSTAAAASVRDCAP